MKKVHFLAIFFSILISSCSQNKSQNIAIVIHGGAGGIQRSNFTAAQEKAYQSKLMEARDAGYQILENGGKSIDAVQAAILILEDSPLFNAGKGAVFTSDGINELDASIMNGSDLNTGAIAGVHNIKNPILAARSVMENSPHVLLIGEGAEKHAKNEGIEMVEPSYFYTEKRFQQLMEIQGKTSKAEISGINTLLDDHKFGTVGAVAIDKSGNIVAGTSTGGMTNKKYGRVGDVPIIGAGTYANNETCGISCTGTGEYFIRTLASHEISSKI